MPCSCVNSFAELVEVSQSFTIVWSNQKYAGAPAMGALPFGQVGTFVLYLAYARNRKPLAVRPGA